MTAENKNLEAMTRDELESRVMELSNSLEAAYQNIKETEKFYKDHLENLNDVVFSVDTKGNFTYLNSAVERITGYRIEEVLGTPFTRYIHPDDLPGLEKDIGLTMEGEYKPYMFRIIKKNGDISYVHTSSHPIIEEGEIIGINGLLVDIAEFKKVEKRLRREKKRAQNYLDVAGVIIVAIGADQKVTLINKKGCEILGYSENEIIGKNWFNMVFPERHRSRGIEIYSRLLTQEIKPSNFEIPILTKDKEEKICSWKLSLIKDEDGKITGILSAGEDITESKMAQKALLRAKEAAENANRTKSEFLANMSHELRTPLNSIIGFSDLLLTERFGELNDKQTRYLGNVSVSGKHLLELINSILDLSKIEAGKMELHLEDFLISSAIDEVKNNTSPLASSKNITIETEIDPELNIITADKMKITQILYNLTSNAIKFTDDGGYVSIHARREGNIAQLSVKDTGIGISKENMKKLFKPFTQLDPFCTREYSGTGLGLSLTKKLTQMHGGDVTVDSKIGKGTKFTIRIPIEQK